MALDPVTAGMGLARDVIGFLGSRFFPEKMSETQRAEMEQAAVQFVAEQAHKEDSSFRDFVVAYEGSARDYKSIPIVGPIVLLLRGLIRPVFTVLVGYLDYLYFTGSATLFTADQGALIKVVNIIILTFWFGERAITNSGIVDKIMLVRGNEKKLKNRE